MTVDFNRPLRLTDGRKVVLISFVHDNVHARLRLAEGEPLGFPFTTASTTRWFTIEDGRHMHLDFQLENYAVLDPTKPLFADGTTVQNVPYTVLGTFHPVGGTAPQLVVNRTDGAGAKRLNVDVETGRVVSNAGSIEGTCLRFYNGPVVVTDRHFVDGVVAIDITRTNGTVTDVRWVK